MNDQDPIEKECMKDEWYSRAKNVVSELESRNKGSKVAAKIQKEIDTFYKEMEKEMAEEASFRNDPYKHYGVSRRDFI